MLLSDSTSKFYNPVFNSVIGPKAFLTKLHCDIYTVKVKYTAKIHILKTFLSLLEITWAIVEAEKLSLKFLHCGAPFPSEKLANIGFGDVSSEF